MNNTVQFKEAWKICNVNEKIAMSLIRLYGESFVAFADFTPFVMENLGLKKNDDQRIANGIYNSLRSKGLIETEEQFMPHNGAYRSLNVTQLGVNVVFHNLNDIDKFIDENGITMTFPVRDKY